MNNRRVKYILIRLGLMTAVLYLYAFWVYTARADDYASFMAGVFMSGEESLAETKFVNIGHRDDLAIGLSYQYEFGGWVDVAGKGRRSSAYVAYQVGVEAGESTLARVMVGPALITHPDVYLGGPFEFTEDFFLGLRGKNGNIVGVKYKHFSSGGLYQPNVGRDLLGVEASIKF